MGSIRIFLISSILATLTLTNFIAVLRGYQSSITEVDILFDNELLDLSHLLANIDLVSISSDYRLGKNRAFQVWENNKLVKASFQLPQEPISNFTPGFDFANFEGYRWRTFTQYESANNRWVIVAERTDLRFLLAENVVLKSITPILLGIPLIGLIIWVIVSRGLKPLQQLSIQLGNKHINDLSPINDKDTRQELYQVIQSINGFIIRLNQSLEREKRFSADAAHELRTPISALKIQLHNLQQELGSDSEFLEQLQQGVIRMQHLVEQLFLLFRNTPEQFADNCREIDLYEITQNVIAQNYPLIESKNQNLELVGNSCRVLGESFAIEALLTNLFSNATKYTQSGGKILVKIEQQKNRICLIIEDNGPGIPESDRERVFERFYRSSQNDTASIPGCGLGLTIVKHVADLHEAKVSLEASQFKTGCSFKVSFSARS